MKLIFNIAGGKGLLQHIKSELAFLRQGVTIIMASKEEIIAAIKAEREEVKANNDKQDAKIGTLETDVVALKQQIANGSPVTAADLQEILDGVKGIYNPPAITPPDVIPVEHI